jgi:pantothenate kinase
MLSMILQLGGLANLIIGIAAAAAVGDSVDADTKNGKLDYWNQ